MRACCCSRFSSSAALEEKAKLRRRVCRLQHARGRDGLGGGRFCCVCRCCGGHGHRGSGRLCDRAGLQNHDVLLVSQPAASASAARPIHCDRSAPDGKRAEPVERRNSDDDPRGVRAAAARRRCGVCIERVALGRMAGLSGQWSCRRGEHGASQARDKSVQLLCQGRRGDAACGRSRSDGHVRTRRVRRTTSRYNAIKLRRCSRDSAGFRSARLRVCSPWESPPANAACTPRAAPRGFVRHSPARRRRRLSSPAPRR